MRLSEIKPYKKNAKKHEETQIKNVMQSIKEFGVVQPIVVDRTNTIIIGHCRYEAMKRLGFDQLQDDWVKVVDLSEEEAEKLRLLDNKLNESEWDMDLLAEYVPQLDFSDFDIDWGLPEDIEENTEIEEDEAPEVDEDAEPIAKLGDIWQLGRHRLMCGDSTDKATVELLMDGKKADMVFTDPPYNIQTEGGCKGEIGKALKKQGKDIEFIADFEPKEFLNVLPCVFSKNMNAYIFCNKELLPSYLNWAVENRYSYNVLVWKKPNAIPIADSHRPDIEYMLLFRKNAIWNNGLKNVNYSRCLEAPRETGLHPTMKPISLITNEMQISSNKYSNVVDLFGGSGSTLIACEQLDRTCYMMELDPKYCDVIVKRWENFTGKKAVKLN